MNLDMNINVPGKRSHYCKPLYPRRRKDRKSVDRIVMNLNFDINDIERGVEKTDAQQAVICLVLLQDDSA